MMLPDSSGKSKNYSEFCKTEADNCVIDLRKSIEKYVENVCLKYLQEPSVKEMFKSNAIRMFTTFKKDNLDNKTEIEFLNEIRKDFNVHINNLINKQIINSSNIRSLNDKIIETFSKSKMFLNYEKVNMIDLLIKKVKKIYE